MILLVDFHVHCCLLLSKRAHLKESPAKKGTSRENLEGADAPSATPPPCCGEPVPELWYIALLLETIQISRSIDFMLRNPEQITSIVYVHVILLRMYERKSAIKKEQYLYCGS